MDCSTVRELLSAFYDGELQGEQKTRVSEHLICCSDCAQRLAMFENLSAMTAGLAYVAPPEHIWSELQGQLANTPSDTPAENPQRFSSAGLGAWALATTILVVIGVSWLAIEFSSGDKDQTHFTAEFGNYLKEFHDDPDAAGRFLVQKYDGKPVDAEEAEKTLGYEPIVFKGLPPGYMVQSTHVLKMPCCVCVHCLCKRSDGTSVAILEHDKEEPGWFGNRPAIQAKCNGQHCRLVELNSHIATSWKLDKRHVTLIGVRDVNEAGELVAWFDEQARPAVPRP